MKPVQGETTTVQSNVEGRHIKMELDANSLAHIISVLTDPYTDPKMAVIREYSTNGWDSHIEAGHRRPIKVKLPTKLSSTLEISDEGVGLNEDDIVDVYSKYGASTKRDTDEQTGILGLGCKSALTYTKQFTLIGTKDGIRTVVSVTKEEGEIPEMTVVNVFEVQEPNGVKVIVPVKEGDHEEFAEKAAEFFSYWPEGSVLVNDEKPARVEGLQLTDSIMLRKKGQYDDPNIVVMGNVPYPVPNEVDIFKGEEGYRLVAWVGMGEVNFTPPGRESLQLTKRTRRRLEALNEEVGEQLTIAVQKDIEGCKTANEALIKVCEWRKALAGYKNLRLEEVKYKGTPVPTHFAPQKRHVKREISFAEAELEKQNLLKQEKDGWNDLTGRKVKKEKGKYYLEYEEAEPIYVAAKGGYYGHKPGKHEKQTTVLPLTFLSSMVVYGYNASKFTPMHKRKLEAHAKAIGLEPEHYLLSDLPFDCRWLESNRICRWDDIRTIKIDRAVASSIGAKITGAYEMWYTNPDLALHRQEKKDGKRSYVNQVHFQKERTAEEIDTSKPIYYFTAHEFGYRENENDSLIGEFVVENEDCTVVRLGENRVAKFNRDFPAAKPVKDRLQEIADKVVASLSDETLKAKAVQESSDHEVLQMFNPEEILDPDLKKAIGWATLKVDGKVDRLRKLQGSNLRKFVTLEVPKLKGCYELAKTYPLLAEIPSWRISRRRLGKDVTLYVNATYRARKEEAEIL